MTFIIGLNQSSAAANLYLLYISFRNAFTNSPYPGHLECEKKIGIQIKRGRKNIYTILFITDYSWCLVLCGDCKMLSSTISFITMDEQLQ